MFHPFFPWLSQTERGVSSLNSVIEILAKVNNFLTGVHEPPLGFQLDPQMPPEVPPPVAPPSGHSFIRESQVASYSSLRGQKSNSQTPVGTTSAEEKVDPTSNHEEPPKDSADSEQVGQVVHPVTGVNLQLASELNALYGMAPPNSPLVPPMFPPMAVPMYFPPVPTYVPPITPMVPSTFPPPLDLGSFPVPQEILPVVPQNMLEGFLFEQMKQLTFSHLLQLRMEEQTLGAGVNLGGGMVENLREGISGTEPQDGEEGGINLRETEEDQNQISNPEVETQEADGNLGVDTTVNPKEWEERQEDVH